METIYEEEPTSVVQLRDIKVMLSLIETVSKRGAFNLADYKAVGELYENLKVAANSPRVVRRVPKVPKVTKVVEEPEEVEEKTEQVEE